MIFLDDKGIDFLEKYYYKIEFFGEYKAGNTDTYNIYLSKFLELLNNKYKFSIRNEEEFFLNEYLEFSKDDYDLNSYLYYFFDVDDDCQPELSIIDTLNNTHIFKYSVTSNKFILWTSLSPSYYQLNGSLKVRYNNDGTSYSFYELNKNGEMDEKVSFFIKNTFNKHSNASEIIYCLSLPKTIVDNYIEAEYIKKQGYFVEDSNLYYFRTNEKQFKNLTKNYFEAEQNSIKKLKKITLTYNDLIKYLN